MPATHVPRSIDLNADVGEGALCDAALAQLATSVNVACGAHAGDYAYAVAAIESAIAAGTRVGAHPGHADREGFGRRAIGLCPSAAAALVSRQLDWLTPIAARCGAVLAHVKPHGALYHQLADDALLAEAVVGAIARFDSRLMVFGPARSRLEMAAAAAGLRFVPEAFADRAYRDDGRLAPRDDPGATIADVAASCRQALLLAIEQQAPTLTGTSIDVPCDTLCVHGDGPRPVELAAALRRALAEQGVDARPPAFLAPAMRRGDARLK